MAELRILNGNPERLKALLGPALAQSLDVKGGDTYLELATEEQVAVGRSVFEALIKKGWAGYEVTETGKTKRRLNEYDPDVFRMVMFDAPAGG